MRDDVHPQHIGQDNDLVKELMRQLDQARFELRRLHEERDAAYARADARLRSELDRAQTLLDSLGQVVFVLDEYNQLEFLAGNVIGISGYTDQEARERLSAGSLGNVSPPDLERLEALIRRARIGLSAKELDVRFVDRAGEKRWLRVRIAPMRDGGNGGMRLQGIITDVSEQRRIERAIDSLSQASSIVQHASLRRDDVLRALVAALSSLGFLSMVLESEDAVSLKISAHRLPPGAFETIEQTTGIRLDGASFPVDRVPAFSKIVKTGEIQRLMSLERCWREILPHDLPELAAVLARVAPSLQALVMPMIAQGELLGILLVGAETIPGPLMPALATFANQAAVALRNARLVDALAEREVQYRSVFENTPSGLVVVDEQGTIEQCNPALREVFGQAAIEGKPFETLLCADDLPLAREIVDALARGKTWHGSATGERRAGGAFPIEMHCGPLYCDKGRHSLVVLDDVSEQVQARAALVRAERLRALGQMAGGIAHDFNNILVGIRGFADLALLDIDEDQNALRQDLDHILRGANDAAEAVRRLQSLYRASDDRSDFEVQRVDELLEDVLALTRPRWRDQPQSQGVTIHLVRELSAPPAILGNGSELRRVLTNLVVNAVEAMPEGGELTIASAQRPGYTVVTIGDTGQGIASDKLDAVFEPFYSTKESSGLGLAIARSIIERHGGTIQALSELGVGTTFEVRLPWFDDLVPKGGADAQEPEAQTQLAVLVVDDEAAVLGLMTRFLARSGHGVEAASTGQQALDLLAAKRYDLLVTDLGMPDVSGYAVAERAHALYPDMPIILSTGWGDSITPAKLQELHAVALLSKPFTHQEVTAAVKRALGE